MSVKENFCYPTRSLENPEIYVNQNNGLNQNNGFFITGVGYEIYRIDKYLVY